MVRINQAGKHNNRLGFLNRDLWCWDKWFGSYHECLSSSVSGFPRLSVSRLSRLPMLQPSTLLTDPSPTTSYLIMYPLITWLMYYTMNTNFGIAILIMDKSWWYYGSSREKATVSIGNGRRNLEDDICPGKPVTATTPENVEGGGDSCHVMDDQHITQYS